MDILIFIYNIFLIVLYTVVLTFCMIHYKHKKRPLIAAVAVLFIFYILDNVIIYMTEFLEGFSARYDMQFMSAPSFKTLIFLVTSSCLVFIQCQILPGRRKDRDIAALALLGLGLLFIPMAGNSALKVWLYYLPAQLFTLYLSASGLRYLKKHPQEPDREMSSYKRLLRLTVVFSLLIILEDTIVIFSFDIYSDIMVKINNRSISEDILSIIYSICAIRYLTLQLQLPALQAPHPKGPGLKSAQPACGPDGLQAFSPAALPDVRKTKQTDLPEIDTAFLHFINHYQLTSREQDILRILLADKNNQEISDALFISVGTVKTHVHNIFQKVNVTKRRQILKIYSEYQKNRPYDK